MKMIDIRAINVRQELSDLFPTSEEVYNLIKNSIVEKGFNEGFPVHVVQMGSSYTMLDGHTRLRIAKELGIKEIPSHVVDFGNDELYPSNNKLIKYAIKVQRDRRNLTKEELTAYVVRAVEALDSRKPKGGDRKSEGAKSIPPIGGIDSCNDTAALVGVSARQVERIRTVLDSEEVDVKEALKSGKITINAAAEKVKEVKKEHVSTFNKTNDNIEWASWSWNPVTGCEFGCTYCYARDIANRFYDTKFKPTFHEDRLKAPANTKPTKDPGGAAVFVCSMADLFGDWVPNEWIFKVLQEVEKNPQWTFIFLTKNPKRLKSMKWPDNAWVGTTVDTQKRVAVAEREMAKVEAKVRFISLEPMLEEIKFSDLSMIDWLIIGGKSSNSKEPEFQPEWPWVWELTKAAYKAKCKVYWKPNLTVRPKEYPCSE